MSPRSARVEAFALASLAALPLVPYLAHLAAHGVDRFAVEGDYAGLELATRWAPSGRTLLGPYSRFGWNHPGPLWFYLAAPIYALWRGTSSGLFAAACVLNAATAATIVATMRVFASRGQAYAALVVVLAWLAAFGNVCVLPWNPLTIALPLLAFLVHAALFARGHAACACGAALFGLLAAETHVATVPTVAGIGFVATLAFAIGARRRGLTRRERWLLVAAASIGLAALVPPVVEEWLEPVGNLKRLARFLTHRSEPYLLLTHALRDWAFSSTWLPDRAFSGTIAGELAPKPAASMAVPLIMSASSFWTAVGTVVAALAAALLAWRRRDAASGALIATGGVASVLAIVSLRGIIGPEYYYLVFWTTAGTSAIWIGVLSALAEPIAARMKGRAAYVATPAVIALAIYATTLQQRSILHGDFVPHPDASLRSSFEALRARLARDGATAIVHVSDAWESSLSLLLELSRDGLDARVEPRDRWILGRQFRTPDGARRPLHVWAVRAGKRFNLAPCLEKIATSPRFELYVAPHDVGRCRASP